MSCRCKGMCDRMTPELIRGYSHGQKFCKMCNRYYTTRKIRCTCCNMVLRSRKRHNKIW